MVLAEGIDYSLEGVDYVSRYEKLIRDTFDDNNIRQEVEPLWHIIDVFIDRQARDRRHLFGDADLVYMSVEDFCKEKNVDIIPPLYEALFKVRESFMAQMKFPLIMMKEWINRFPQQLTPRNLTNDSLVLEFKEYLEKNKEMYNSVLIDLELFGFEYIWSDDEEDC